MFHLACYTKLLGTTANTDIDALTDDILTINSSNHFLMPKDLRILGAYAASATLSRARLTSPSLRQTAPTYIRPFNLATLVANDPNIMLYPYDQAILIRQNEELAIEATSAIAMGTERFTGLVWFTDGIEPAPVGDEYRIRATSTTAAVANTWTTISYSLETTPPVGIYAVVGAEVQATNCLAFRMIFDDQVFRPGFLGITALGNRSHWDLYHSRLGKWGNFKPYAPPRIQVLNNSTDAAHEIYFNLIRIGR